MREERNGKTKEKKMAEDIKLKKKMHNKNNIQIIGVYEDKEPIKATEKTEKIETPVKQEAKPKEAHITPTKMHEAPSAHIDLEYYQQIMQNVSVEYQILCDEMYMVVNNMDNDKVPQIERPKEAHSYEDRDDSYECEADFKVQ